MKISLIALVLLLFYQAVPVLAHDSSGNASDADDFCRLREAGATARSAMSSTLLSDRRVFAGSKTISDNDHTSRYTRLRKRPTIENPGATPQLPLIHRQPPLIHREPPLIHREPPLIHRQPPLIHREPPLIHREPSLIHRQPPLIHRQPPLIHRRPPQVQRAPASPRRPHVRRPPDSKRRTSIKKSLDVTRRQKRNF